MTSWNPITVLSSRARASAAADAVDPPRSTRHPLGFTDVRAPEAAPSPASEGSRPVGFAPAPQDRTGFRTELSFRRQPRVLPAPPAIDLDAPPAALPVVGRPLPVVSAPSLVPVVEPSPSWLPLASADGDKVPFYKREITFRRRKDDVDTDSVTPSVEDDGGDDLERVPFGFGREHDDAQVAPDAAEPEAELPVEPEPDPAVELEVEVVPAEPAHAPEADVFAVETPDETLPPLPSRDEVEISSEPVDEVAELDPEPIPEWPVHDEPVAEEPAVAAEAPAVGRSADEPGDAVERAPEAQGANGRRSLRARPGGRSAPKKSRGRSSRGGNKVVGLKIGASQLAAAVVSENDGRHELLELARTPLEPGIVVDGEVKDMTALAGALRSFFEDHKLPKRDVRIGLASNRIGVRTFEMAGAEDEERFDNAVRFKAHEVLPVAVHESVLDYRVLDERASETGEPVRRVFLVVAPRDQIEPYLAVCADAGLRLSGIDLEALGLLRAFVEPRPFASRTADDTATVVVTIGHEVTTLLVAGGGACEFTRVFDWGGGTLQSAIAQELDVHPAEAATILRHLSLSGAAKTLPSLDDDARARALEAVRGRLTPFARELVSSLQFYQTQSGSLGIGEIVITGGTSHLAGLGDALHQMIGVSVRVGDPLQRVSSTIGLDSTLEATLGSMAVPIGLALEDDPLRSVNLIPREMVGKERRGPSLVKIAAPVAVAVPLAALAFAFVQANGNVSDRESELSAVRSQIAALPEPKRPQIDPGLAASEVQRASALAGLLGGRVPWDAVLRDVSLVLPANVSLTRLAAQLPAASAAGVAATTTSVDAGLPSAPTGVEVEGYTDSQPSVARLLARLRSLPSLSNVQLQSSTQEEVGQKQVVRFVVLADMAGGAS